MHPACFASRVQMDNLGVWPYLQPMPTLAPVAQWTEQEPPKFEIPVRVRAGAYKAKMEHYLIASAGRLPSPCVRIFLLIWGLLSGLLQQFAKPRNLFQRIVVHGANSHHPPAILNPQPPGNF